MQTYTILMQADTILNTFVQIMVRLELLKNKSSDILKQTGQVTAWPQCRGQSTTTCKGPGLQDMQHHRHPCKPTCQTTSITLKTHTSTTPEGGVDQSCSTQIQLKQGVQFVPLLCHQNV